MLITQIIKKSIFQLANIIQINNSQKKTGIQGLQNEINCEIVSLSDLSEMTETWEFQKNSIGGISLFEPDKQNLILEINQILVDSSILFEDKIEESLSPYHHKYMEKTLAKILAEKSTSEIEPAFANLKKCDNVEANLVCLLICDVHNLICLSSKYIIGGLLESSNNFILSRYFTEEAYQFDKTKLLKKPNNKQQKKQEQGAALKKIQLSLVLLQNQGLQYKVPRVGFEGKYYYQTIASQIVFNLILQGFYKQSLIFQEIGSACQLANLNSSNEMIKYYAKQMIKKLNITKSYQQHIFIDDERVIHQFREAIIVNIAYMQNIIFIYDQCQAEPFLSKLPKPEQIDIPQEKIEQFYDYTSTHKIFQMQKKQQSYLKLINEYQQKIQQLQHCKRKKIVKRQFLQDNLKEKQIQYKQTFKKLQNDRLKLEQQLKQLKIQQSQAMHQENQARIPRRKKVEYERKIQDIRINIEKIPEDQRSLRKEQMKFLSEKYKQMIQAQNKAYQNFEKKKMRVKQKQMMIDKNGSLISKNYQQRQQSYAQIQYYSWQKILGIYDKTIFTNKHKIEQLKNEIPNQIKIQSEEQRRDSVVKLLIQEYKYEKHLAKMFAFKKSTLQQINRKSNIPKDPNYKFLQLYVNGQLNNLQKTNSKFNGLSEMYYAIFIDGIQIQSLVNKINNNNENDNIVNIRICNVIILYLSFINNMFIRQDINGFIQRASEIFALNYRQRHQIQSKMVKTNKLIEQYKTTLNKIPLQNKNKSNREFNNTSYHYHIARTQLQQYQIMLRQFKGFPMSPIQLFRNFLKIVYNVIDNVKKPHNYFIELLFGFFQCKIIRQCQVLDFLSDQYVLVRHNSKIIQQLLLTHKGKEIFAYYFDQQDKTVLCRFQDVLKIITTLIKTKHIQVLQNYYDVDDFKKNIYVCSTSRKTKQNQALLELSTSLNRSEQRHIRTMYEKFFIGKILLEEIRALKRSALEYFLKKKHQKSDDYYFVSHQIMQYHFLEKVMKNMNLFNCNLLKDIVKKKDKLKEEFQSHLKKK